MAITTAPAAGAKLYTVLRPICIAGERVEVGSSVELTLHVANELSAAGKVGPHVPKAEATKPAKKAPEA